MVRPTLALCLLGLSLLVSTHGQTFTNHRGPWNIVFKIPHNKKPSGYSSIVSFWEASGSYNANDATAKSDFSANANIFKSPWLDDWDKRSFSAVRMSAYKNNKEQAYVVFDSMGKNKNEWLNCDNIIDSSYSDLTSTSKNYCSMKSGSASRNFFLNHYYGGCNNDIGWFILKDYDATSGCSNWDPNNGYPYTKYSTSTGKVVWGTGSDETADCFVVSVMAWDMVFKGVEGVAPPQGGLRQLWQGSDTLNSNDPSSQSLTWAPGKVYKSTNVEQWRSVPGFFIESVKYAMFNGGKEVAFSIYDGRDTDKNGWFVDARILYSRWTDIKGYTKVGSSIDGDGTRRFALWKEHGGCPNDKAWMAILDSSDNSRQPCSWDKNVRPRPYFLYSNKRTWALCQSNNAWNSAEFPHAEALAIFIKGWRMVMKVAHGQTISPASSIYNLYTGTYTMNEYDSSALTIAANTKTYKAHVIDNWSQYSVDAVRLSMYKDGMEKAYVVFDAHGATKTNWYDCSRILYTSFSDLNRQKTTLYCSIEGNSATRRFFLQNNYGGCSNDAGWFVVVEGGGCGWEQRTSTPYFMYSSSTGYQKEDSMSIADVFLISVVMDNCSPNPCQNSGTCYDEGMDYTCTCSGSWFGQRCTDKNGGWSSWASWGSCTRSCGGGTKTRSRSCTNPTPAGNGASCSGSSSSSTSCNTHTCAVNGNWGSWGSYGGCTVTCGGGTKTRSRSCNNPAPAHGGQDCSGSGTSSASCNTHHCPIDGNWSSWTSWGSCTVTCGGGTKTRARSCTNPSPQYGGASCSGSSSSSTSCNTHHCPIDGGWTGWSGWGSCTVTCGGGIQSRSRSCTNPTPQYGGAPCSGFSSSSQSCNTHHCPIDGGWSSWGSWATCSLTCGGGTQGRSRSCTNPSPQYNGAPCPGSSTSSQACHTQNCPIDGAWSSWGAWGTCTVTCGGGSQTKTRSCSSPTPQYGGALCVGDSTTSQDCNTQVCIIDGNWGAWAAWGTCTVTCGGGRHSRSRVCNDPASANGGLDCQGDSGDFNDCNTQACPTVAAGTYQQLCPAGWFTCQSGTINCIEEVLKCDCDNDCDDGSDETEGYGGCSASSLLSCSSAGTATLVKIMFLLPILAAVFLIF